MYYVHGARQHVTRIPQVYLSSGRYLFPPTAIAFMSEAHENGRRDIQCLDMSKCGVSYELQLVAVKFAVDICTMLANKPIHHHLALAKRKHKIFMSSVRSLCTNGSLRIESGQTVWNFPVPTRISASFAENLPSLCLPAPAIEHEFARQSQSLHP